MEIEKLKWEPVFHRRYINLDLRAGHVSKDVLKYLLYNVECEVIDSKFISIVLMQLPVTSCKRSVLSEIKYREVY